MRAKTSTDIYWNDRALSETDLAKVNMPDTVQRDSELKFISRNLWPAARLIEIGCGNGYTTQQLRKYVSHVDGFDFSENMIEQARRVFGQTNNRFIHDDVLDLKIIDDQYDAALCVRVLMNLNDLREQKTALQNIAKLLCSGGRLILIEGFRDGYDTLSAFRQEIGLPQVVPANHNFYSYLDEIMPTINEHFVVEQTWHTGLYDFLTRVVFPCLVGAENATKPGDFHAKVEPIVQAYHTPEMMGFARVRGFVLARR